MLLLRCSLPLTGLSPQQGPVVQFFFMVHFKEEDKLAADL